MTKRNFLVVIDGTDEMQIALQFACIRAKKTNGQITLVSFIEPIDVLTTKSVSDIMKNEAREEAEAMLHKASAFAKEETGITAILHVKEGELIEELLRLIEEKNENVTELILAASKDEKSPGPIIKSITTQNYFKLNVPLIIVPGNLTLDEIKLLG
tara:strand:- start:1399 stop:1866 length:468 start_codon:yes stop_codon:yes gene_type:complete